MEELTDGQVSRKVEHALNRKILAIIGFFCFCQIIISILSFSPRTVLTNSLASAFAVLNSSMNIIIYCSFDGEFRKEFKKIVCCCFNSGDKNEMILNNIIAVKWLWLQIWIVLLLTYLSVCCSNKDFVKYPLKNNFKSETKFSWIFEQLKTNKNLYDMTSKNETTNRRILFSCDFWNRR